jgi:hypothetical protein
MVVKRRLRINKVRGYLLVKTKDKIDITIIIQANVEMYMSTFAWERNGFTLKTAEY